MVNPPTLASAQPGIPNSLRAQVCRAYGTQAFFDTATPRWESAGLSPCVAQARLGRDASLLILTARRPNANRSTPKRNLDPPHETLGESPQNLIDLD